MWKEYLDRVREQSPLVHCITNVVTVNDCANIVLAAGGSPTMASHPEETGEIAARAASVVLNLGNVAAAEAMIYAGRSANQVHRPVVLDPVGVGASLLRQNTFRLLTNSMQVSLIRGNATEIRFLATGNSHAGGVDAALEDQITEDNVVQFARMASSLAAKYHCVVSISGLIDVVADEKRAFTVRGGCADMSRITGTGCMLTALMGAFLGANPEHILEATVAAQAMMDVAGTLAEEKTQAKDGGTMTLRMHLIDAVSLMTGETLEKMAQVESLGTSMLYC